MDKITLEVDRSALFDAIAATGDGGQAGRRSAGRVPDFFDAYGLAAYGITVAPATARKDAA